MTKTPLHNNRTVSAALASLKRTMGSRRFLRTMTKFFLSACIISIAFLPIYAITLEAVEGNEVQAVYGDFESNAARLTGYVSNLISQTDVLLQEQSVSQTVFLSSDLAPKDYMTLIYANNFLRHSIIADELVINAYILPSANDIFLSGTLITQDRATIYDHFYSIDGYSRGEWEEAVLSSSTYRFLPQANTSWNFAPQENQIRKETVHLIIPSSSSMFRYKPNCFVVYLLSAEEILDRLMNPLLSDGFLYITDQEERIILSHGFEGSPFQVEESISTHRIGREKFYLMAFQDASTGIDVVVGMPSAHFVRAAMPLWRVMILHTVVIAIIAILSSLLMAYRQDKPIRNLLDSVKGISPVPAHHEEYNEYEYLSDTIISLDQERRVYEEALKSMRQSISAHNFDKLLQGEFLTPQELEQCAKTLDLPGEFYTVCIIKLKAAADEIKDTTRATALSSDYLEKQCGLSLRYFTPEALKIVLIISLDQETPCTLSPLRQQLESLLKILADHQIIAVAGLGVIACGLRNIYSSADCALSALRVANEDTPVQFVSNLVRHSKTLPYDHNTAQRLYDLLIVGDGGYISDFFRGFSARILQHPPTNKTDACQIFYGLYNTVSNAAQMLLGDSNDLEFPQFTEDMSVQELLTRFQSVCLQLCGLMADQQRADQETKAHGVIEYIQENYTESSLCALTIAEYFSVSEKYVFSLVKNHTGKTLGDFIEELRFRRVEELLAGDVNINTIPAMVGFNSVNTFYKAFKRNYGVSPGKWRSTVKGNR